LVSRRAWGGARKGKINENSVISGDIAVDTTSSSHYKGTSAKQRHERVQAVEVVDAHRLRFVRSDPGVELVLEANERYWRTVPSIKRIIYKGIPESPTRLAMLKTGEADIAYLMYREEGRAVQQDPKLRLVRSMPPVTWYLDFPAQWDPKSPWHDRRVRLAASYASTGRRSTKWSGRLESAAVLYRSL
jgi:hypothetical protein